jgi:penicillin-binding protein 1A
VVDEPVPFLQYDGKIWTAQNAWKAYTRKKITLRYAMAKSYNSVTCYLVKQLTPKLVATYAQNMGIKGPLEAVPSIGLGSSDVSIYEMVGAYSTFLNKGVWTEPFFITHITDKQGNILQSFIPQTYEAIHEDTADLMTYMLKGSLDEGALRGVSSALKDNNEIAGKSGTTSNHSDGWFIGLTQGLCTGVWVGGEDRCIHFRDFELGQGAVTARPIWEKFILKLYNDPDTVYQKGPLVDPSIPLSEKVKNIIQTKKNYDVQPASDTSVNTSRDSNHTKKAVIEELDINNIF